MIARPVQPNGPSSACVAASIYCSIISSSSASTTFRCAFASSSVIGLVLGGVTICKPIKNLFQIGTPKRIDRAARRAVDDFETRRQLLRGNVHGLDPNLEFRRIG